jgi:hypothetical protein
VSGAGPVAAFVACAERYCALIESAEELARGEFVWRAGELLAELYVAGLHLPAVDATDDDVERQITHEEAFHLFEIVRRKLGDLDEYKGIFDPYDLKEALSSSSLADDLTDVHRDIKNGLLALEQGAPQDAVLWEWRFGLDHWGVHAAAAIYAIHWITRSAGQRWISPEDP